MPCIDFEKGTVFRCLKLVQCNDGQQSASVLIWNLCSLHCCSQMLNLFSDVKFQFQFWNQYVPIGLLFPAQYARKPKNMPTFKIYLKIWPLKKYAYKPRIHLQRILIATLSTSSHNHHTHNDSYNHDMTRRSRFLVIIIVILITIMIIIVKVTVITTSAIIMIWPEEIDSSWS